MRLETIRCSKHDYARNLALVNEFYRWPWHCQKWGTRRHLVATLLLVGARFFVDSPKLACEIAIQRLLAQLILSVEAHLLLPGLYCYCQPRCFQKHGHHWPKSWASDGLQSPDHYFCCCRSYLGGHLICASVPCMYSESLFHSRLKTTVWLSSSVETK